MVGTRADLQCNSGYIKVGEFEQHFGNESFLRVPYKHDCVESGIWFPPVPECVSERDGGK